MVSSNQLKGVDNLATTKNITMKQFNGTDYDTLYPKTKVEQVEGAYSQQQILADSTKTLYGLGADAVPDNVFAKIGTFMANLSNAARIENGTYTGTGAIEKTITFQNPPKLVIVFDTNSKNNVYQGGRSLFFIGISGTDGGLFGYDKNPVDVQTIPFSISGNKAIINKGGHDAYSVNKSGRSYSYVAIG